MVLNPYLNQFKISLSKKTRTSRKSSKISVSQIFLAPNQNRVPSKSAPLKAAYHKALLYFRTGLTPKFASICIAAITFLSLAASMPMYLLAHIKGIEEFQKPLVYEDILICKSTWSRNERVIYNTGSCVLQFLIPFWFIVSSF